MKTLHFAGLWLLDHGALFLARYTGHGAIHFLFQDLSNGAFQALLKFRR